MMLSMKFPYVRELLLSDFHGGLMPVKFSEGSRVMLIVKATKEMILTAKYKKGFYICAPLLKADSTETVSLMSIFPDDEYDPLTIRTPIFDEPLAGLYRELFQQKYVDVYFFTENNVELLGYKAAIQCSEVLRSRIQKISFLPPSTENGIVLAEQLSYWFNEQGKVGVGCDDVVSLHFENSLFPENFSILDVSSSDKKHATDNKIYFTELERREPGAYQEVDISHFFSRLFDSSKIFVNPMKKEDREEISDLIIVGEDSVIIVQAKDSPNTENIIGNTLERKKATSLRHLAKAQNQIGGAIKYVTKSSSFEFFIRDGLNESDEEFLVEIDGKSILGLIVIKELFHSDYYDYTSTTMKLCNEIGYPCIVFDFFELHKYTMSLADEKNFILAYNFVYEDGKETGIFPRLQFAFSSEKDD